MEHSFLFIVSWLHFLPDYAAVIRCPNLIILCIFYYNSQQFLSRGIRCWELQVHVVDLFSKVIFCLWPFNLGAKSKPGPKKSMYFRLIFSFLFYFFAFNWKKKLYTCLECWSQQSILHGKWFKHKSNSFCKFEASQLIKHKCLLLENAVRTDFYCCVIVRFLWLLLELLLQQYPCQPEQQPLSEGQRIIALNLYTRLKKIKRKRVVDGVKWKQKTFS